MAEYCLHCINKIQKTNYTERDLVLSWDLDLCEGCGEIKKVVVGYRRNKLFYDVFALIKKFFRFK